MMERYNVSCGARDIVYGHLSILASRALRISEAPASSDLSLQWAVEIGPAARAAWKIRHIERHLLCKCMI